MFTSPSPFPWLGHRSHLGAVLAALAVAALPACGDGESNRQATSATSTDAANGGAAGHDGNSRGGAGAEDGGGAGGSAGEVTASAGPEVLYDESDLPTFELSIPSACRDALLGDPRTYCEGSLRYRSAKIGTDDQDFPRVGIRLKGRASMQDLSGKPSLKVKLDEYVDGARLMKTRRITLNNMVQDPSMAHECLGYTFLRAAGVPASRCNFARVVIDGTYYGLYANLETIDDEFAERRWKPAPGNLYDTSGDAYFVDLTADWLPYFVLETNKSENDTSDLAQLVEALAGPDDTFWRDAGARLAWDEILKLGAAQAIMADWDGFFGATNNYMVYHELASDRFVLLPWGIDQTFGTQDDQSSDPLTQLNYRIDHSSSNRPSAQLWQRCRQDATCFAAYLDAVEVALVQWKQLGLPAKLDTLLTLTAEARAEDTRSPADAERQQLFIDGLKTFLKQREAIVRAQLTEFGR